MSERVEKLLKAYPEMVQKRDCLAYQLAHFKGVSAEEVIASMMTPKADGERVQSSGLSDKTAQIAMTYRDRQDRCNREWYEWLEKQWQILNDEVVFLESAICSLSGRLPKIMYDMVINRMTWNALAEKYYVSQRMIGKYRRNAIRELEQMYAEHDLQEATFMLS